MYKKRNKKPKKFDFDLIVIGTGAGGGVAAHIAAAHDKKVAAIEDHKIGGECPNFGCVPTKALLQAAENYLVAKDSARFGIKAKGLEFDYKAIKAWKDSAVQRTGVQEGEAMYASEKIVVFHGHSHFLDPWTISVKGLRFTARNFVIATGTSSVAPPIPGLKEAGYITYRQAIDYTKLPKSLFVIGGGAIGCEFAHLFGAFGAKVHIAEFLPELVPVEDAEVGQLIAECFEKRGIKVHTNTKVVKVEKSGNKKLVHYEKDGKTLHTEVDEIMVAAGMRPNTDMGLENAGVNYGPRGIKVNRFMQTSVGHIYAAGDVVGPYGFTHTAAYQSRIAAHNIFNRKPMRTTYHSVPRCVFIDPEVACVGMTEKQLKEKNVHHQVGMASVAMIGRANTSGVADGFVKVLADKKGVLLGASIVGPRAGEVLHELVLAVHHQMKASDITETIHAFPTWSETVRLACLNIRSK